MNGTLLHKAHTIKYTFESRLDKVKIKVNSTYSSLVISLFSFVIALNLVNLFLQNNVLTYVIGILAIMCIGISFHRTDKFIKYTGSIFLLIGIAIIIITDESFLTIPTKMLSMLDLLGLIIVLPFITSIIKVGKYEHNVNKLLKANIHHLGQVYNRGSLSSFLVGSFLNLATLPLLINSLLRNLSNVSSRVKNKLISQSVLRGYSLCLIWSPMELLVAMTVDVTGVGYTTYLPWLLLLSFLLLLLDWLTGLKYKKYLYEKGDSGHEPLSMYNYKKMAIMIFALALFITSVNLFRNGTNIGFITSVTLVIIPFSIAWSLLIKRFRAYLSYSVKSWQRSTSKLQNYFFLFLSAGFFITMLKETSIFSYMQHPFLLAAEYPILLFVMIQVIFLLFAMVGFHPLVTFSILGEILKPLMATISPISIGFVLIMSSLSTAVAGPYNLSVSLTGSMLKTNPYFVSLWNLFFALLFGSAGTILALFFL